MKPLKTGTLQLFCSFFYVHILYGNVFIFSFYVTYDHSIASIFLFVKSFILQILLIFLKNVDFFNYFFLVLTYFL